MSLHTCPCCNHNFTLYAYQHEKIKLGEPVYCSVKCKREVNYKAVCDECGCDFMMNYDQKRSSASPNFRLFCSRKCKSIAIHTGICSCCDERFYLSYEQKTALKVDPDTPLYCSKECKKIMRLPTLDADNIEDRIKKIKEMFPGSVTAKHFENMVFDYSNGSTLQIIGDKYGVSKERVRQILNRYGVDTSVKKQVRKCELCGNICSNNQNKFCSDECRLEHRRAARRKKYGPSTRELYVMHVCDWCGNMFIRSQYIENILVHGLKNTKTNEHKTFCNKTCYGSYLKTSPYAGLPRSRRSKE